MGMLFSPLSALSMTEIPASEMAQASGLINVIRQVGGSFRRGDPADPPYAAHPVFHTAVSGAGARRVVACFHAEPPAPANARNS